MIKYLRLVHFYLGVFFAPTIIFFSFSGALQTFSLHENHQGKPGIPWVTALAEVHKNQRVPETWTAKEPAADPAAKPVGTAPTQVVTTAKKLDLAEREQEAKPGGNLAKLAANPAPPGGTSNVARATAPPAPAAVPDDAVATTGRTEVEGRAVSRPSPPDE